MSWKQETVGWIGERVNGISFNIDLMNYCPLHCSSCAVGSIGRREKSKPMTIEFFRQILDKAESECKVRKVQLYAYSDPCMHPDLHLFVAECAKRGIESDISTMLQTTKCDFAKVIEARPTEFRISFAGFKHLPYYQAGGKLDKFLVKFYQVVELPRYKETRWNLVFHLYNDNADEIPRARRLAEDYNLNLIVLPAIFMPLEKMVEQRYSKQDKEIISHMIETPEESVSRMVLSPDYCMQWKQITIDAAGMVYLCQLVYETRFQMASFLETPLKEIRRRIRAHPFCGKCMKSGGNQYQACFSDMAHSKDPIGEADKLRRKSKQNEMYLGAMK